MSSYSVDSDHPHLVPLRTSGSRTPLYCFPGAGGEIEIFADMALITPDDRPVYAIRMSEFFSMRNTFTIEQLAGFCLQVIRNTQQHGPYYFCGYSMGGVVAYETATSLASEGEDIGLLALFDTFNPAFNLNLTPAKVAQFRNIYVLDRLKKYCHHIAHGNMRDFMTGASAFVISRGFAFPWLLARTIFRLLKRPIPNILKNNAPMFATAIRGYRPRPYTKRLVLFRSQGSGPAYDIDSTLGWSTCAVGGIDVHVAPGGHVDMMSNPQFLVDTLTVYLNKN
jgi:thioesterase domain-containing protein